MGDIAENIPAARSSGLGNWGLLRRRGRPVLLVGRVAAGGR